MSEEKYRVAMVPIKYISPSRNSDEEFSEESVKELAEDIKAYGQMHPIIVYKTGDNSYEILSGEKRFRAVKYLQWKKAPCNIYENMSYREAKKECKAEKFDEKLYELEKEEN